MKRKFMVFLILVLCLTLLSACGKDEIPEGPAELWVVTELTEKYGMNDQAERMIAVFQETYPDVTVKLDILPTDEEERAVYLEKIRTQIMSGGGPDVYLMPTNNIVPDESSVYGVMKMVEPLFRDVSQQMYNGLFYDISEFYDEDETLEKEELNTSVMDGGIMDGCRYVLPLRYDIGVYLVDRENLEARGMDISVFEGTIGEVMAAAIELKDKDIAWMSSPNSPEYYFSAHNNYQTGNVALTAEEVAEYMRLYQARVALCGYGSYGGSASCDVYISEGTFFASEGLAVHRTQLSSLMGAMTTAKIVGEELEVYPLRASDGSLNAIVRYYAAVGANTAYPKLAYEFVRLFLSDEAQLETYLSTRYYSSATGSVCVGWPVRVVGSAEQRFLNLQSLINTGYINVRHIGDVEDRKRASKYVKSTLKVTDEDLFAVFWEADNVLFPVMMESTDSVSRYCSLLNDSSNNKAPANVNIDALAREVIDKMQFYLDEG